MTAFVFKGDDGESLVAVPSSEGWVDVSIGRYDDPSEEVCFSLQPKEMDRLLEVLLKARLRQQEILDGLD